MNETMEEIQVLLKSLNKAVNLLADQTFKVDQDNAKILARLDKLEAQWTLISSDCSVSP